MVNFQVNAVLRDSGTLASNLWGTFLSHTLQTTTKITAIINLTEENA